MCKKIVPDPPIDTTTPDPETSRNDDLLRDREAINRALDYYLDPATHYAEKPRRPSTMFMIAPDNDSESLLVHACESLACASVLASDFAAELIGPQRHKAMAIQQVIMLAELAVSRAVDNVVPT
ncbi:hypothetical protein B7L09_24110 [Pseudomonas mandelii]|jgi:hypothetical protein|uniref:DUF6124 family protein n=1 Tax=Pseudomonas TaxID=286 RepID=UPI000B95CA5F|nr:MULTISPECIES: DUF6124 family protein [Pseudomonas]OYQ07962.1 hypothetical protein B7L09_24110 [Pseudomonas mandelii]